MNAEIAPDSKRIASPGERQDGSSESSLDNRISESGDQAGGGAHFEQGSSERGLPHTMAKRSPPSENPQQQLDGGPAGVRRIYVGVDRSEAPFLSCANASDDSPSDDVMDTSNKVKTSKYTAFNFVFCSIYHQMKSVVNIYFLFTALMQLIPILAQASAFLSFTPLCILLIVNATKDGFEDVRRHMSDSKVNRKFTTVLWGINNYNLRPQERKSHFTRISRRVNKKFVDFGARLYDMTSRFADYIHKPREKGSLAYDPSFCVESSSRTKSAVPSTTQTLNASSNAPYKSPVKWTALSTPFVSSDASTADVEHKVRSSSLKAPKSEIKIDHVLGTSVDNWIGGQKIYNKSKYSRSKRSEASHPEWIIQRFSRIAPGDFVILVANDEIPADCLILSSSNPDNTCFVETKNLDGETNYKVKKCAASLVCINTVQDCSRLKALIELELPNPNLSSCSGKIHILKSSDKSQSIRTSGFSIDSVLLRGCVLRNTSWVVCLVLYTGNDAKIMQNSGKDNRKVPKVMRTINIHALTNIVLMAGLCLICTIAAAAYANVHDLENAIFAGWTVNKREPFYYTALIVFLTCVIIFQNIVPISLAVSIEGCKLVYSFLIYVDNKLFDDKTGTRAVAQSWNLADDLGQIEYFFTDKTGTLTLNLMKFKKVSLNGKMYQCSDIDSSPIVIPSSQKEKLYDMNDASNIDISSKSDLWPSHKSGRGNTNIRLHNRRRPGKHADIINAILAPDTRLPQKRDPDAARSTLKLIRNNSDGSYFGAKRTSGSSGIFDPPSSRLDFAEEWRGGPRRLIPAVDPAFAAARHSTGNNRKYIWHLRRSFVENYPLPSATWADGIDKNNLLFPSSQHSSSNLMDVLFSSSAEASFAILFLTSVMLCHSAMTLETTCGTDIGLVYSASSPDEGALLEAARAHGFAFLVKNSNSMKVSIMGTTRVYNILEIIEFSSDRKRMSVVVDMGNGKVFLLCKGADSVILKLLSENMSPSEKITLEKSLSHILDLSHEGLRVMMFAYKVMTLHEYNEWLEKAREEHSFDSPDKRIMALEKLERNLSPIGVAGIEDKLQEGVPSSIKKLIDAGVKVWMLTGDKVETAITIGVSCNLITRSTKLIRITGAHAPDLMHQLTGALESHWSKDGKPKDPTQLQALIMDGETLKYCLSLCVTKSLLLELGCRCSAVLFCRVSPLQKAQVVGLVSKGLGAVCLSAGDGANDVSMIRTANIGVGIRGKEGSQAVMAADYAVDEFRNIVGLMLIHGRKAYIRVGSMTLNYFYKNVYLLMVVFWYQYSNSFSGSIVVPFTFTIAYNPLLTLLASLTLGIFENDVGATTSLRHVKLYRVGMLQAIYNTDTYFIALAEAVYQSGACYLVGSAVFQTSVFSKDGVVSGYRTFSNFIAVSIFFVSTFTSFLSLSVWHWPAGIMFLLSLFIFFLYCILDIESSGGLGFTTSTLSSISQWTIILSIVLIVTISLLPRLLIKSIYRTYHSRLLICGHLYEKLHHAKRKQSHPAAYGTV